MNGWEEIATILYKDGATIRSLIHRDNDDVCLTLARSHDDPDVDYVITRQQANEIIYVLSKALMIFNEQHKEDEVG